MHDVAAPTALVRATRWSSRRSGTTSATASTPRRSSTSPAPGAPCSCSARCSAFRPARWRSPGHDHRLGEQRLHVARRAHARGRAMREIRPRAPAALSSLRPARGAASRRSDQPTGADPSRRPPGQTPLRLANAGVGPGVGDALGHRPKRPAQPAFSRRPPSQSTDPRSATGWQRRLQGAVSCPEKEHLGSRFSRLPVVVRSGRALDASGDDRIRRGAAVSTDALAARPQRASARWQRRRPRRRTASAPVSVPGRGRRRRTAPFPLVARRDGVVVGGPGIG